MGAVVIFDVSLGEEHNVIKNMCLLGYATHWECEGQRHKLPKNVVWKPDTEVEQAKTDLQTVIERLNVFRYSNKIKLSRCIVLNSHPWAGIIGE